MRHIFLADLHLLPGSQPEQNQRLKHFLEVTAAGADGVYFLGDLFHCWFERGGRYVGDYAEVLKIFSATAENDLSMHLITGNRDFPAGELFESLSGVVCHGEFYSLEPGDTRILLTHGDIFCTRDWQYQSLRWLLTGPIGKLAETIIPWKLADYIVGIVQNRKTLPAIYHATLASLGIQTPSALRAITRHNCEVLICGHLHTSGQRKLEHNGQSGMLYVLPDWRREGGYLEYNGEGFTPRQVEELCTSAP